MNTKESSDQSQDAPWLEVSLSRLGDIIALPNDWDSDGSPRIRPEIIRAAETLLRRMDAGGVIPGQPPRICPIPGGTLQLEWDCATKYVEFEFVDAEDIRWLRKVHEPSKGDGQRSSTMLNGHCLVSGWGTICDLLCWYTKLADDQ